MGQGCCKPEVSFLAQCSVVVKLMNDQSIDFEGDPNLFHFYLLRSVGKGAFGKVSSIPTTTYDGADEKVRVVQHKNTKTLFALKYINKPKCVKMKAVANIVQERRLLEEVSQFYVSKGLSSRVGY
jgi:serine/threonine kinase 32